MAKPQNKTRKTDAKIHIFVPKLEFPSDKEGTSVKRDFSPVHYMVGNKADAHKEGMRSAFYL